jgi:hypothetical protein
MTARTKLSTEMLAKAEINNTCVVSAVNTSGEETRLRAGMTIATLDYWRHTAIRKNEDYRGRTIPERARSQTEVTERKESGICWMRI